MFVSWTVQSVSVGGVFKYWLWPLAWWLSIQLNMVLQLQKYVSSLRLRIRLVLISTSVLKMPLILPTMLDRMLVGTQVYTPTWYHAVQSLKALHRPEIYATQQMFYRTSSQCLQMKRDLCNFKPIQPSHQYTFSVCDCANVSSSPGTCREVIWTGGVLVGAAGRGVMALWDCDWACIWAKVCWWIISSCPLSLRTKTMPARGKC